MPRPLILKSMETENIEARNERRYLTLSEAHDLMKPDKISDDTRRRMLQALNKEPEKN